MPWPAHERSNASCTACSCAAICQKRSFVAAFVAYSSQLSARRSPLRIVSASNLPGFTAGEQPLVHLLHLGPTLLPSVLGHDLPVPLLTHARRQRAIGDQHGDVLGHHIDIPERNETSAPPILHHSAHAAGIASDHRLPVQPCFQVNDAERICPRRHDHCIVSFSIGKSRTRVPPNLSRTPQSTTPGTRLSARTVSRCSRYRAAPR